MSLAVVDEEFRTGVLEPAAPPTRFSINLSERCQLKCAHCITDAPLRTSSGTAREMTAEVLARLAPHLEHARYVALVHAGEPMLAPLFEPLLELLAGRAVVHLLTNGMAMTEARFARAVALGVRSLSFSLDGMSASTNDVLRIGARVDTLLDRIRAIAAVRGDVRVGVSWVCTRANLDELDALVRFAASARLDWIKLEEIHDHNDAARGLVVDRYALDVAVAKARAAGDALGIPVLDHTRALDVWKCRLDEPRMQRRARLDDLVNRVDLNPCRLPWELVCVEPNGDVRPLSFHHPVAGNVGVEDLADIWRGPAFRAIRETTLRTRLCGAGPTTCARDAGPSSW